MNRLVIMLVALLILPQSGVAYIMTAWTYKAMLEQADLVIIAKPIDTRETRETGVLPGIRPEMKVIGVETTFKVSATLKGSSAETIVLHHYRLTGEPWPMAGPVMVEFDPQKQDRLLMFLSLERDGRYASVTGQRDPTTGVLRLQGTAE